MKNEYTPISNSEDSSKTLNDEKSESRPPSNGIAPPYPDPYKHVDLEMGQKIAKNPPNTAGNNQKTNMNPRKTRLVHLSEDMCCSHFWLCLIVALFIGYSTVFFIFLVAAFVYKAPVDTKILWILFCTWDGSLTFFVFAMLFKFSNCFT